MKKGLFILLINLINWLPISGQDVTTFMDIPVDGNENVMIQKLEEKGFKPIPIDNSIKNLDCILNMDKELSGVYNQDSVIVTIVTDKCERKVTRIIVTDMESVSASNIKSRFNNLITQFHKNKNYVSANDIRNCYISENEDLIRKINLKDYFAAFYQTPKQKSSTDPSSSIEKTKKKEEFWRIYSQIPRCQDFKYILELKESFRGDLDSRVVWFEILKDRNNLFYISIYFDNILNFPLNDNFYYGPFYVR